LSEKAAGKLSLGEAFPALCARKENVTNHFECGCSLLQWSTLFTALQNHTEGVTYCFPGVLSVQIHDIVY